MRSTLIPLAITLLSLFSHVTSSDVAQFLPLEPRQVVTEADHGVLAPRASTDLSPRHPLKQVTRQQLLERHARAKLLKARGPGGNPPSPQQSPIPPTSGKCRASLELTKSC